MLGLLLIVLVILWFLGYIQIPGFSIPNIVLFTINGQPITLLNLLIFIVITALIGILPSPLREIAGVVLILWILSILGIIAIAGFSNILVIVVIVGLVLYLLTGGL